MLQILMNLTLTIRLWDFKTKRLWDQSYVYIASSSFFFLPNIKFSAKELPDGQTHVVEELPSHPSSLPGWQCLQILFTSQGENWSVEKRDHLNF